MFEILKCYYHHIKNEPNMENQDDLTISRDTMKGEGRFYNYKFFTSVMNNLEHWLDRSIA